MEKTMEMMFKENKERTREMIQSRKRAIKREQAKENILFTIIAIFILTITCLLLNSLNENSYKNCMEKNNNDNFCQAVYE
jgi:Trk-type K+ transport system membrane component